MPTAAVIADVHANLEALNSVLAEVEGMDLYCLGDLVDYGASPNEVVDMIKKRSAVCLLGNHDEAAITGDPSRMNAKAAMSSLWTTKELTGMNMEYLQSLPMEQEVRLGGAKTYLAHGSPDDQLWEYVDPRTHSDLFGFYLAKKRVELMGLGHTHVPYVWKERSGSVFNPGSVGQPRDGDRRASFAIVSSLDGSVEVEVRRVEYDYDGAASKIRAAGLPEFFADRLYSGI
ncbi:MAG: metallophosphatase family protein [Thaumarchaeota archaeon]|nr:metallophosphatase family protein [Nitrososphaerota archaeon]